MLKHPSMTAIRPRAGRFSLKHPCHSSFPSAGTATVAFLVGTIGMAGQHSFHVALDPASTRDEVSETNKTAWNTATVGPSNLGLAVSTDKLVYTSDENAQVSVNMNNLSSAGRSGTLRLRVLDAGGNIAATVADEQVLLDAAESRLIGFAWNTGETLSGSYKVSCSFTEEGNVIARAERPPVISPVKAITSRVATDKQRYSANRLVTVTSTIGSQSPNYIFQGLTARVAIKNSAGEVLFSEERPLQDLARGGLVQLESTWNTGSSPEGTYAATLDVVEGGAEGVLSASTCSSEVLGSSETGAGHFGTVDATPKPVYIGQDETITRTVTNNGNENLSGLTLTVLLVDADTEMVRNTLSTTLDLAMSATSYGSFTCSTSNPEPDHSLAVLQVSSATLPRPKTLGSTAIRVEPGIEAAKTIPETRYRLGWVNGNLCLDIFRWITDPLCC